ncbi:glycosyltransferase family 2 protein [Alicyclobacillus cellulosilyticus]|nr:glycosyltransferase [Alicyclobacillus cellulosilyticus]
MRSEMRSVPKRLHVHPPRGKGRLAVVIPAGDEARTIQAVLRSVARLRPHTAVVVVNGSTDGTARLARRAGARVLVYPRRLGNDVGRAVGALAADADMYLFVDADFAVPTPVLRRLVAAVEAGADVALNSLGWLAQARRPDIPTLDRYVLNLFLRQRALGLENLLTVPHVLSRRAVEAIGASTLANPLLATAVALDRHLRVAVPTKFNVLAINRRRPNHIRRKGQAMAPATQRIHGDAVEAVRYLLDQYGRRGGYALGGEGRQVFAAYRNPSWPERGDGPPQVSVVFSARQADGGLWARVRGLAAAGAEVVLVAQGSDLLGDGGNPPPQVRVVHVPAEAGSDVALAVGATYARGEAVVFCDAAVPATAEELWRFAHPVMNGEADGVVHDQRPFCGPLARMHPVHSAGWFANVTMGRREWFGSTWLVPPYAVRREALQALGPEVLQSPCLAQMRALDQGWRLRLGPHLPAVRPDEESSAFMLDRVLGHVLEGLWYWTERYGRRGGFTDEGRRRDVLPPVPGVYRIDRADGEPPRDVDLGWLCP